MQQTQFAKNTLATVLNIAIQFTVNFFLTSYLVKTVGSTAYGFFTLANTIVNYALIVSNALNSMSARFVGVEYHNGKFRNAIKYFSSVLYGDLIFVLTLLVPASLLIWRIDSFINVPPDLVYDVRILFFIVFINMCINVVSAVFSGVFVIKNRLDLSSLLATVSNIMKALILLFLYWRFTSSIVYLGIATLITTIFVVLGNIHFTRRLMPEVKPKINEASWASMRIIIIAGVWNSFSQLSIVLLHGFDLLLSNLMVSAVAMGYLSVAGTMPNAVSTCISSLSNLFTPKFLEYFSHGNYDALVHEVKNSIKFMTVVSCIPISFLIGFGETFYSLWTPSTDVHMVYLISICVILPNFTGGAINSVNYLYTVANKVKLPSIVLFVNGILNLTFVFILLKFTNLGVFAIVMVSAFLGVIRNVVFNAPYAAYCIKQKFYIFWPDMIKSAIALLACSAVCLIANYSLDLHSWGRLAIVGGGTSFFISCLVGLFILSKDQRDYLLYRLKIKK